VAGRLFGAKDLVPTKFGVNELRRTDAGKGLAPTEVEVREDSNLGPRPDAAVALKVDSQISKIGLALEWRPDELKFARS
jgi:hypothetical protein